ncbi:MAG: hypothetical protein HYY25_12450 [Candidatus Wallbacteria bacterium]|nr:hypothetical protein [Candidatus Wallbacteria bacterium]
MEGGTSWTYTYTPAAQNGGSILDGVTNVNITNAFDAAGNGNAAPSNTTFTIDTIAPAAAGLTKNCWTGSVQCLGWNAVSDSGSPIVLYRPFGRGDSSTFVSADHETSESDTTHDVTGLYVDLGNDGSTYYGVQSEDSAGNRTPLDQIPRAEFGTGCTCP